MRLPSSMPQANGCLTIQYSTNKTFYCSSRTRPLPQCSWLGAVKVSGFSHNSLPPLSPPSLHLYLLLHLAFLEFMACCAMMSAAVGLAALGLPVVGRGLLERGTVICGGMDPALSLTLGLCDTIPTLSLTLGLCDTM